MAKNISKTVENGKNSDQQTVKRVVRLNKLPLTVESAEHPIANTHGQTIELAAQ